MATSPLKRYQSETRRLARALRQKDVFDWLTEFGYFPECYVLPPCFTVTKRRTKMVPFTKVVPKKYFPPRTECVTVHFPKTALTDRTFGIMHPELHHDIAVQIARNWVSIVDAIVPTGNDVVSYSFPVPLDSRQKGHLGRLRSGRLIYEFVGMLEDDLAAIAYKYRFLVKADIKNFYPSIYTHSIAWALHGKKLARKRINDYTLLGNRLDKLFQNVSDGTTNGVPIGPVVSDIIAEVVASAVDRRLTVLLRKEGISCEVARFRDDYRFLCYTDADAKKAVKLLQSALKEFNLELSEEKTAVYQLPDGLFREWKSRYHIALPFKRRHLAWKQFRELYLAVLRIERDIPGTGVIDRFLADIAHKNGTLKIRVHARNLQKVISMLLMLATLRIKTFPKIIAFLENILQGAFGHQHRDEILEYMEGYLTQLARDEERNKYLITWISYFLVSQGLKKRLKSPPKLKDPITKATFNNRNTLFKGAKDFTLFVSSVKAGKATTLIRYLDVFSPAESI